MHKFSKSTKPKKQPVTVKKTHPAPQTENAMKRTSFIKLQSHKQTEHQKLIGNTSTEFQKWLAVHLHSFKYSDRNQTSLSQYIHEIKYKGIGSTVTWEILDGGGPFSPVSEKCDLCTKEKFHILAQANPNQLNSRNEIFANCMHKKSSLLLPKPRGRKRNPG